MAQVVKTSNRPSHAMHHRRGRRRLRGTLRLDLAQYRELAASRNSAAISTKRRGRSSIGERLVEVLKQRQYEPLSIEKQIMILDAATRGHLDQYAVADIGRYERDLHVFLETRHPAILAMLADRKQIDDQFAASLNEALEEFVTVARTPGFAAAA